MVISHWQRAERSTTVCAFVGAGTAATIVAMLLYLRAVSTIGPSAMGALMALVPVVSGIGAATLLAEAISLREGLALLVTSAGALLASGLLQRRQRQAASR